MTTSREILARKECERRGIDPDFVCEPGLTTWMIVDAEPRKIPVRISKIMKAYEEGWRDACGPWKGISFERLLLNPDEGYRQGVWDAIDNEEEEKEAMKHPGFKAVAAKIGKEKGIRNPGAVLAAASRGASKAAKKANPRLKRVKG